MLRRHLATGHELTIKQSRARWKLPREHALTAPSYSERRSGLAKQLGLGRGRRASGEKPKPVEPEPRQRRNPDLDAEEGRDRRRQRPNQSINSAQRVDCSKPRSPLLENSS